jgi:hypothetical protein
MMSRKPGGILACIRAETIVPKKFPHHTPEKNSAVFSKKQCSIFQKTVQCFSKKSAVFFPRSKSRVVVGEACNMRAIADPCETFNK